MMAPVRKLLVVDDDPMILAAMQAGGDGYLLKDNEPRDIVAAIRTVLSGGMMFDPIVVRAVDRELKNVLPNPPTNPLGELSEQERRVLAAVAAAIAGTETNIDHVELQERDTETSVLVFEVKVRDRRHLARIIRVIRRMPDVLKLSRTLAQRTRD